MRECRQEVGRGTRPLVQAAKEARWTTLHFATRNQAPAAVLAGGGHCLATVINAAIGNRRRFQRMSTFFEGVGQGDRAGVWEDVPTLHPGFRADTRRQLEKQAKKRKAEEMI